MKKFLMIAGIVIVVLILVVAAFIYLYGNKLANVVVAKSLPQIENLITANLPATVNKEQVHQEFEKFSANFKAGKYDQAEMQKLFFTFKESMADKKLDSLEVKKILESLHKLSQ